MIHFIYHFIVNTECHRYLFVFSFCRKFRYIALRQLVRWYWGYLGKHITVALPSCALNKIRHTFPADFEGSYTPYSKMAAILVFFCLIVNWPFWPRSRLNILSNFTFESEVKRANFARKQKNTKMAAILE